MALATLAAVPAIARERLENGVLDRETTRAQLLEEVTRSWQRPEARDVQPMGKVVTADTVALATKLNEIVIPHLSFAGPGANLAAVIDALGSLAEQCDTSGTSPKGANIVLVDPEGRNPLVRLTLREVSLKRVLDLLAEQAGYEYEIQADAVLVRPGGKSTKLETRIFPITRATVLRMTGAGGAAGAGRDPQPAGSAGGDGRGAMPEAVAIRAFLQQAGVGFDSEPGASLAYDGSAIIVTQTPRNTERIRNIFARYNEIRQVEIESKFMEVQEGALEELGVTWGVSRRGVPQINPQTGEPLRDAGGRPILIPQETYGTATVTRSLAGAFPSSANANAIVIRESPGAAGAGGQIDVPVAPTQIPGTVHLGTAASGIAEISGFVGEFDVNAIVRALSQKQGTDLLSSPRITVLSGSTAHITVAQELRYPQSYGEIQSQVGSGAAAGLGGVGAAGVTITAGTPQDFSMRNVGVELRVTPTVEEDDYSISLDLNPKVTEFEGFVEYGGPSIAISAGTTVTVPAGFYQPIFSVRDISTRVTLWDGATLVMGGLTREEVRKVDDKVPILGDIPIIGRLFRSKGESAQKRNLLIFVTASLVNPGGAPARQALGAIPPNAVFKYPTALTPAGSEPRARP